MRLLVPIMPNRAAPLGRANPVAKLAAALVIMAALFASLDAVTAGIVLVGLVALLPVAGLPVRPLLARLWLVGVVAVSIGVFNVLFAAEQVGPTVLVLGPLEIGAGTLANGAGLALRLLAIVLVGVLATATSEPIEVADALIQQLRVSPRFAIGVLAALRLLPLLAQEWQTLGVARRARGVEAGRSPVAAIRLFAEQAAVAARGGHSARGAAGAGNGGAWLRRVALPERRAPAAHARVRLGVDRRRACCWQRRPSGSAWRSAPGDR